MLVRLHRGLWAMAPEDLADYRQAYDAAREGPWTVDQQLARALGDGVEAVAQARHEARGSLAVVPVMGALTRRGNWITSMLGWATYEGLALALAALAADKSVGTIVLRVDSPGGAVAGLDDAMRAVAAAAKIKPVLAVADGTMASAAYGLASAATEIVAAPLAEVGSVGVLAVHLDRSGELAKAGIVPTVIAAGKHKGEANPYEPLTDGDRDALQARIDAAYALFTAAIAKGRGVDVDTVRTGYGEGRVLHAKAAKAAGLVDRIATLTEVIGAATTVDPTSSMRAQADDDLRLTARRLAL